MFARAIMNFCFTYIVNGETLLKQFDEELVQLHSFVIFELVGFQVDTIYVKNQLKILEVYRQQPVGDKKSRPIVNNEDDIH